MNTDVARILGWTHNEYDQHDPLYVKADQPLVPY